MGGQRTGGGRADRDCRSGSAVRDCRPGRREPVGTATVGRGCGDRHRGGGRPAPRARVSGEERWSEGHLDVPDRSD
ncbi:hypothetical protein KPATCC21470_8290 [Kitasatospora purpeofusca]